MLNPFPSEFLQKENNTQEQEYIATAYIRKLVKEAMVDFYLALKMPPPP